MVTGIFTIGKWDSRDEVPPSLILFGDHTFCYKRRQMTHESW
jgi:hypothetical protein